MLVGVEGIIKNIHDPVGYYISLSRIKFQETIHKGNLIRDLFKGFLCW